MRPSSLAAAAALTLAALAAPRESLGNGRFPAAQLVQVSPDGRSVALRVTFGFALSEDSGRTFRWLCEDVIGYGSGAFDPAFTFDGDRRLFVGAPDGLARVSADRCQHDRIPALERDFVIDLDRSADGATVVAITSSGADTARNRVWRSDDRGQSFTALGAGVGPQTLFETVELARSNPQRVYATAVRNGPRRALFFRSDDGGRTLTERPLDGFNLDDAFVAAVDPSNADRVFVRGRLQGAPPADAGPTAAPTVLLVTDDGGATFREAARSTGAMTGFAISDDGRTVWYGSTHPDDGLRRSTDGGATFTRVNDARVTGLRYDRGALWVAANWVLDGFALGRSEDGGRTITPVLRTFCELGGAPSCVATSDVTQLCGARWPLFRSVNLGCAPEPTSDAGPVMDAGPGPRSDATIETYTPQPGCRCAAPAPAGARRPSPLAWALSLAFALSARRAAAPDRPGPTRSRTR